MWTEVLEYACTILCDHSSFYKVQRMLFYEFIDTDEQLSSPDFKFVESFLKATKRTQIGWHYITDIVWIYSKLKDWPRDLRILDAGGGHGPLQFLLTEMGFEVVNIDLLLGKPSIEYHRRYGTSVTTLPSFSSTSYLDYLSARSFGRSFKEMVRRCIFYGLYKRHVADKYVRVHNKWRSSVGFDNRPVGKLEWVIGNLCHMPEIESHRFDAIVSLSSIEHIPFEKLQAAICELNRVSRESAKWALTTSGTEKRTTWFHKESQGHCFSVSDIERIFDAHPIRNQEPLQILDKYRRCDYLRRNVARFYRSSGANGLPWGVWDPKYIPIGICTEAKA